MAALSRSLSTTSQSGELPVHSLPRSSQRDDVAQSSWLARTSSSPDYKIALPSQHTGPQIFTRSEDSSSCASWGDFLPDESEQMVPAVDHFDRIRSRALDHATGRPLDVPVCWSAVGAVVPVTAGTDSKRESATDVVTIKTLQTDATISVDRGKRPRPLPSQGVRFSFDAGDDLDVDLSDTLWTLEKQRLAPLRRSLSLNQLRQVSEASSRPRIAGVVSVETPSASRSTTTPVLPSPLPSTSPALSKIPSPVFDASLAKPRREDSLSSVLTAVRHSEMLLGDNSGEVDTTPPSSHDSSIIEGCVFRRSSNVSNSSSNESGKMWNGQRLIREETVPRRQGLALSAARAAGALGTRTSANDDHITQHGGNLNGKWSASIQSRVA